MAERETVAVQPSVFFGNWAGGSFSLTNRARNFLHGGWIGEEKQAGSGQIAKKIPRLLLLV
jgi:hypothetical protein